MEKYGHDQDFAGEALLFEDLLVGDFLLDLIFYSTSMTAKNRPNPRSAHIFLSRPITYESKRAKDLL